MALTQISTEGIKNGTITTADLAADAVTAEKILDDAVRSEHIADDAVGSAQIADGAIVNADINASAAIAGTKISPEFGTGSDLTSQIGNRQRLAILGGTNGSMLHIRGGSPAIFFDKTGTNFGKIYQDNVNLGFYTGVPTSEGTNLFLLKSDGNAVFSGNLDVGAGIDVTGDLTVNGFVLSEGTSNRGAILGKLSVGYNNLYLTIQPVSGQTNLHLNYNNGNEVHIGDSGSSALIVNGNIRPKTDSARDLGLTGTRFRAAYVDTYYGDGSNLTGITSTTINNNANDRIITGTGTANTLEAESNLSFNGSTMSIGSASSDEKLKLFGTNPYIRFLEGSTEKAYIQWNSNGWLQLQNQESGEDIRIKSGANGLIFRHDGTESKVFHAGNDGSGSGLDADTLDGVQGASFLRSDAADTASGNLTFNGVVAATNDGSTPDKIGNYKICRVNGAISSIDNLDSFLLSKIDGSYTGGTKPSGSHNGVGIISMQTHTGNYFSQLGLSTNTSDLFIRSANGTTSFDSWQRLAKTSTGNIIGYSPNFPAGSAENIKDAVSGTPDNGWYWIQQFGNVARLHYCAFKDKNGSDIAGGPWTMNWVAGVHPNQFSTTGSTALSQYMNLCKGIGIDKAGRGMESSRTTSQVYGAWLAVKRALWDLDPGFFNGASSGSGGVLTMPIMNINGEGGSSDHRLVYSTGTSTHIPPNQDGDHCNQNQLFCGWWGGNDFSSWATDNNSVPSPEDWGPGDAPHTGDIGAKSNSTQQKPSWKDMMLITCIYK